MVFVYSIIKYELQQTILMFDRGAISLHVTYACAHAVSAASFTFNYYIIYAQFPSLA